jgi:hypothetical protein
MARFRAFPPKTPQTSAYKPIFFTPFLRFHAGQIAPGPVGDGMAG